VGVFIPFCPVLSCYICKKKRLPPFFSYLYSSGIPLPYKTYPTYKTYNTHQTSPPPNLMKKNNPPFTIREYGRQELACLYCPSLKPDSAWKKLRQWMALYPGLDDRLRTAGYNGNKRSFTPLQVSIIVEAMGEP